MQTGTGKTKVAIDEFSRLFLEQKIDAVIIIAPKGVCANWWGEMDKHLPVKNRRMGWHGANTKKQREDLKFFVEPIVDELPIFVINIEALRNKNKAFRYLDWFMMKLRTMMIIDESTRIKNSGAKQSMMVHELAPRAMYRRILTGTPTTNSALDLFGQFWFLDPEILGFTNWFSFRARYGVIEKKTVFVPNRRFNPGTPGERHQSQTHPSGNQGRGRVEELG